MNIARCPPKYSAIRKIALALPGAHEVLYGGHWFNVGKKTFMLFGDREQRWIFKLPRELELILFETRPETFSPMIAGKLFWSYVEVKNLRSSELKHLITTAWRCVAPKKLQNELTRKKETDEAKSVD